MASLITPKTYMVGATVPNVEQIKQYLQQTEQTEFMATWNDAISSGIDPAEALVSMFAKLCYSSLVPGRNENITSTRSIHANVIATMESGHGSVFEHVSLNFVTSGCSRVFTHELVRHRVGTAFSQTSGRYVKTDSIKFVMDPLLSPAKDDIIDLLEMIEMRREWIANKIGYDKTLDFATKKKMTSALRRVLPEGLANEIAWSINIRSLRHLIMLRTSRHAEWEIRAVFCEVFNLVRHKYALLFNDARTEDTGDGLFEVTGMTLQPYQGGGR